MVVAAVRFQCRVTGSDSPVGAATDRVLAGFRRAGSARGRGQVAGVRWGQADAAAAVAANGGADIAGLRDGAIIAVASDAMLRVSEIAALRVSDIERTDDGTATVKVRRSKTDQEGEGAVLFLGAPTLARLDAWCAAAGVDTAELDAPLFQRIDKAGTPRGPISARSVPHHQGSLRRRRNRRARFGPLATRRLGPVARRRRGGARADAAGRPLAITDHAGPLRRR